MKSLAGMGIAALWGLGLVHAHGLFVAPMESERQRVMQSQFLWGERYLTGQGVAQDERRGIEWLHLAAQNGSAEALVRLAELHADGIATDRDPVLAHVFAGLASRLDPSRDMNAFQDDLERRMSTRQREDATILARRYSRWKASGPLPRSSELASL